MSELEYRYGNRIVKIADTTLLPQSTYTDVMHGQEVTVKRYPSIRNGKAIMSESISVRPSSGGGGSHISMLPSDVAHGASSSLTPRSGTGARHGNKKTPELEERIRRYVRLNARIPTSHVARMFGVGQPWVRDIKVEEGQLEPLSARTEPETRGRKKKQQTT